MNAYVERFNRSIQEGFANYNLLTLRDNTNLFNIRLKSYLNFYNNQRPHLGLKKDVEAVYYSYGIFKTIPLMCHMGWTGTFSKTKYNFKRGFFIHLALHVKSLCKYFF